MDQDQQTIMAMPENSGAKKLLRFWQQPNQLHWLSEYDARMLYGMPDLEKHVKMLRLLGVFIDSRKVYDPNTKTEHMRYKLSCICHDAESETQCYLHNPELQVK